VLPTFAPICKLLSDLQVLIPVTFRVNHPVYGKYVRCQAFVVYLKIQFVPHWKHTTPLLHI
jgi:hypothetical protein